MLGWWMDRRKQMQEEAWREQREGGGAGALGWDCAWQNRPSRLDSPGERCLHLGERLVPRGVSPPHGPVLSAGTHGPVVHRSCAACSQGPARSPTSIPPPPPTHSCGGSLP